MFGEDPSCSKSIIIGGVKQHLPEYNLVSYIVTGDPKVREIRDKMQILNNNAFAVDCRTNIEYSAKNDNQAILEAFQKEDGAIESLPGVFKNYCSDYDYNKQIPNFVKGDYINHLEMQQKTAGNLQYLGHLIEIGGVHDQKEEILRKSYKDSDRLSDAYILVNNFTATNFSADLTVNGIYDSRFHRRNGFTSGRQILNFSDIPQPTEGFIS